MRCELCPAGEAAAYNCVPEVDVPGAELRVVVEVPHAQDGLKGHLMASDGGRWFLKCVEEVLPGVAYEVRALHRCTKLDKPRLVDLKTCRSSYYDKVVGAPRVVLACGLRVGGLLTGVRGARRLLGYLVGNVLTTVTVDGVSKSRLEETKLREHLRFVGQILRPTAAFPQEEYVSDLASVQALLRNWIDTGLSLDLETTGLDPMRDRIRLVGLSDGRRLVSINLESVENWQVFGAWLRRRPRGFVMHNSGFDALFLAHHFGVWVGVERDTWISGVVGSPGESSRLKAMGVRCLGLPEWGSKQAAFGPKEWATEPLAKLAPYNAADAYATWKLSELGENTELERRSLAHAQSVARLRYYGVGADVARARTEFEALCLLRDECEDRFTRLAAKAGWWGNLRSTVQLKDLFFSKLGLPATVFTKTGSESLSEEWLSQQDHEAARLLLRYREAEKELGFFTGFASFVTPDDGRVHPDWRLGGAATWRLSCSKPNLQQLPTRARAAYVASPGRVLLSVDLSQAELRVAAALSLEPLWVSAYKEGRDLHTEAAQRLYGKKEISKEEREFAKMLNFATCYGLSEYGLSKRRRIDEDEARGVLSRFWASVPTLAAWFDSEEEKALKTGEVVNVYGRRRVLGKEASEIHVRNQARNTPIQGAVAEIVLDIMVALDKLLPPENAFIVMQIHDEIVFDVRTEALTEVAALVREEASRAPGWMGDVPLKVDLAVGDRFSDLEEYQGA